VDPFGTGYTIMIDWSARDLQFAEMEVRLGPVKAKDTATTLGSGAKGGVELRRFEPQS
jgi:2-keto-4-pentenoate hydratase/2-oxohepta-3-ene-1,7-dioic acid hydratase in catechol pathway